MFQRDFEYASIYAFERLGDVGLAALGRDRQRAQDAGLRVYRERLELLAGSLDPGNRSRRSHMG